MKTIVSFFAILCAMMVTNISYAGGCLPGEDCYNSPTPPARIEPYREKVSLNKTTDCSGWGSRFAAGAPVWMFDDEDTEVGGGIYYDLYSKCSPINFRVGGEVNHMRAGQPNALAYAEKPGEDARLTFVRVPFAVEYMTPIADSTLIFAGLGPDIINTANDISDTTVGMHVSARVLHNFSDSWGAAIEAGYMWGEVNDGHGDVNLDNTFVIPTLSYTF